MNGYPATDGPRHAARYTAAENADGVPYALRCISDALRAIGRAWYGDDRVALTLPP